MAEQYMVINKKKKIYIYIYIYIYALLIHLLNTLLIRLLVIKESLGIMYYNVIHLDK